MVLLIFGLFKGENNTLKTKLMIYFVLSKIVERGHVSCEARIIHGVFSTCLSPLLGF